MATSKNQNWFGKNARTIYFSAASLALGVFATLCLMRCGGRDGSNDEKNAVVKSDTTLVVNEDDLTAGRQVVIIKNGDFVNGNKVENDGDNNKTVVSSIDVRGSNNNVDSDVRGTVGNSLTNRDNARNNFSSNGGAKKPVRKSVKKPEDEVVVNVINNDCLDEDQLDIVTKEKVVVNVINNVCPNGGQSKPDTIKKKKVVYISTKLRVPIDCSRHR
jgi:hypothetical protein